VSVELVSVGRESSLRNVHAYRAVPWGAIGSRWVQTPRHGDPIAPPLWSAAEQSATVDTVGAGWQVAAQLTQANPGMAALLDEGGGRRGQQELMAAVRPRRLEPWESGLVPVALALTEKTVPTGCLNDAPCPPCTSHSASIRRRVNGQVHAYLALKVHDVIVGALRRAYVYEDVAFHTKVARLRAAREQAEAEAQVGVSAASTSAPLN
jgi:hypothetical protein